MSAIPRSRRRWSNDDHHIGRFITYAWREAGSESWYGAILDSGDEDSPGCHARFYLGALTVLIDLPAIIKPWVRRVVARSWDEATIAHIGRNWYETTAEREFGFQIVGNHISIMYGPQTDDSSTERRLGWTFPWGDWRVQHNSLYDLSGELFYRSPVGGLFKAYQAYDAAREAVPKARFEIEGSDGTVIVATTCIRECERRRGTRFFKWLSPLLFRPVLDRWLDIDFSAEVGPEKGSWKGGMTGAGIELEPGELHEAAFRRFCEQRQRAKDRCFDIKFLRRLP